MRSHNRHPVSTQAGFTLVEIMVGLAIGLLATIVIMQVFSVFEAQKRTTTGSADAQTNGNIALYEIQRELQMAGYPLIPYGLPGVADSALECATLSINGTTDNTTPNRLSPLVISDGGASGGSDSITIRYGSSLSGGIPVQITATPVPSASLPSPAIDVPVTSNMGCSNNDIALIINGAACAMAPVAASGVPVANSSVPSTTTTVTLTNNPALPANIAVANALFSCLGNSWNEITYAVNTATGNLERTAGGVTTPMVAGIVNLQAQYGIALTANSNQINQWVDATGTWATPGMTLANRNRIKAIRVAIVARNAKMETSVVTNGCSSTAPNGPCSWDATSANPPTASPAPPIDLRAYPSWQQYRYRVFDTIIPLRNMVWYKGTL